MKCLTRKKKSFFFCSIVHEISINQNTHFTPSGTASNGTCTVNCDDGYYTVGNPARCYAGVWMEPLPRCEEQTCSHLPFSNVNRTASDCNGTTSQSTCEIICNEGYTATQNHTTCVRGGWTGNVACEPNPCVDDLPMIAQMDRTASQVTCNNTASNSTCEISCENGYTSSGSLECSLGLWIESTMPTCDMDCSSNPPIRFLNNTATMCQSMSSGSACENVTCLRSPSGYYSRLLTVNVDIADLADLIDDAIPSPWSIYWDPNSYNYIGDGGGDMYDGGNYLEWNSEGWLPYKYGVHRNAPGLIEADEESGTSHGLRADYVWDGSGYSGFGATYKTSIRSSSMILETTVTDSGTFRIYGNLGADGGGYIQTEQYDLSNWKVFRKSTFSTGDPTINHLIFLSNPVANAGVTQTTNPNTHLENHQIMNIAPGTQLIYILYATHSRYTMSSAEHQTIIDLVTDNAMTFVPPVCYNGTYVKSVSNSVSGDFSTYASVETYESTIDLICGPDPCDSEPLIANYTGSGCANTASNATCDVNCDQGYHQVNGPATCYAGVWTEPLPTCEEDPCPDVRQS